MTRPETTRQTLGEERFAAFREMVSEEARRISERDARIWLELEQLGRQKRMLDSLIKLAGWSEEELALNHRVADYLHDRNRNLEDEDSRLIETAKELIKGAYGASKYEGRDLSSFFEVLFGRISDEMLGRFVQA